jgi:hypothetical protein
MYIYMYIYFYAYNRSNEIESRSFLRVVDDNITGCKQAGFVIKVYIYINIHIYVYVFIYMKIHTYLN